MAKLTVYFNNKVVCSYPLVVENPIHIGRDETNDLPIDSTALAPAHAVVVARVDGCVIKQLHDDFPLIVNGQETKATTLHNGDTITAGQHDIVYGEQRGSEKIKSKSGLPVNRKIVRNSYIQHIANFQVISGTNIGKIFHLKIPMTLIGDSGNGIVIVSKRKEGYFASVLETADTITLNKQPLGDSTIRLEHGDVLVISNMAVQFYLQ